MDQFFSVTLREGTPDLGDVTEMKEGCLTHLINMLFKQHILVKNDSKVFTVALEVTVESASLFLRHLGPQTITSVLSEFKSKKLEDIQVLISLRNP